MLERTPLGNMTMGISAVGIPVSVFFALAGLSWARDISKTFCVELNRILLLHAPYRSSLLYPIFGAALL